MASNGGQAPVNWAISRISYGMMLRYSRISGVRHSVDVEVALSHMPLRGRATCQPQIRATPVVGGRRAPSTGCGPTLTEVTFRGTRSGRARIGVHSRDLRYPREGAPTDSDPLGARGADWGATRRCAAASRSCAGPRARDAITNHVGLEACASVVDSAKILLELREGARPGAQF